MSETHKPFRPAEPSPNRKGANAVSRYFRIGKSKAQVKKKERRSTHDHKTAKYIQLRERWQFVDNRCTEGCGEKERSKSAFQQTVSESKGRNRKVYRNWCRKCDVSRETQIKCGAKPHISELWRTRAVTRERVCLRSPVWFVPSRNNSTHNSSLACWRLRVVWTCPKQRIV